MPVRKIPKNALVVTGSFASKKNGRLLGCESLLERDYMILLEFDETVESFEEQPVKIPFKKGIKPYVPDILIHYKSGRRLPLLAEVKTKADLERNRDKYTPKFEVARIFAREKGWEFGVVTEDQIRVPRLKTLKFLRAYYDKVPPDPVIADQVKTTLREEGAPIALDDLLERLSNSKNEGISLIPTVWHLVATKAICIDYDKPISEKTLLSYEEF